MSRATRLRDTRKPASARSAQIRGTPYVPRLRAWERRISAASSPSERSRAEGPRDRQA